MSSRGKEIFTFDWDIVAKKDLANGLIFVMHQPELARYSADYRYAYGKTLYKGATLAISKKVIIRSAVIRDYVPPLYFYLEKELFGIDLRSYKELKEVPLTAFLQEEVNIIQRDMLTKEGFIDVAGERVYEAIQLTNSRFGKRRPNEFALTIPVGDYKKLHFRLGAGQNDKTVNQPYTIKLYGEDYYDSYLFPVKNQQATLLFEQQITNNTALKKHTVDVSKHHAVYLEIDHYNNKENEGLQPYPVIIEGMKASK